MGGMDSTALLDYALFQLTPTRTRCDLVIYSGKKNEKIASGLLEPFLSHLKSAKDEISKGGYSVTLKPPSDNSPWFTKATLQRFVRFVSTPEVLERFVTTEREIHQIERSIESNEQVNGSLDVGITHSKRKFELNGSSVDAEAEENPKIRLQKVLESRKAMLKKEQAMAYARALVAGFESDEMHNLLSFSDAFGAIRLREACVNFIELCNKKNNDKIWMDEVAAMQASYLGTPGIILAPASNDLPQMGLAKSSTSDSISRHGSLDTSEGTENAFPLEFNPHPTEGTAQTPMWPHYHPYMHNTHGPAFQHMPPYPGYIFPGMPWAANFQDSGIHPDRDVKNGHRYKSSTKKMEKRSANHGQSHSMSNGESVESDASSSRSDSSNEQEHETCKKSSRRSSKRVVIRNINYITSARHGDSSSASDTGSSSEDEHVDAGSLKHQVQAAVGSLKRHQNPTSNKNKERDGSKKGSNKSKFDLDVENAGMTNSADEKKDGNWDTFQNLLMREPDPIAMDTGLKAIQVQEKGGPVQKGIREDNLSSMKFDKARYGNENFVLTERSAGNRIEKTDIKFEVEENFHGIMKRSSKDEELLIPSRIEGEYYSQNVHFGTESSVVNSQKEEDWILGSKPEISVRCADHNIFQGDQSSVNDFESGERKRGALTDDSFMVQSQYSNGPPQDQPKADIFVVSDIVGGNEHLPGSMQGTVEDKNYSEPDDLFMILRRDSAPEQAIVDISLVEAAGNSHGAEPKDDADASLLHDGNKSNARNSKKVGKEADRKVQKPKAPSGYLEKSKSDIASRSKAASAGTTPVRSKAEKVHTTPSRSKAEKEEEKRKRMEELLTQRQKRIAERSAGKGITPEPSKRSSKESKNSASIKTEKAKLQSPTDQHNKMPHKPVMRSPTIDRLTAPRAASKQLPIESKVGLNKKPISKGNSTMAKKTGGTPRKQDKVYFKDKNTNTSNKSENDPDSIEEKVCIGTVTSVPEASRNSEGTLGNNGIEDFGAVKVLHAVTSVEKRETIVVSPENTALDDTKPIPVSTDKDLLLPEDPSYASDRVEVTLPETTYPVVESNLKSTDANFHEKGDEKKKISFSPQISVMDISTPPLPDSETSPELIHSRKKWNNGESSPKITRGFRKLLLFGRRT